MGNLNCCNCIEKKETQINSTSNHKFPTKEKYKKRITLMKTIEFSKLIKENKGNKYDEKLSFYSLEEEEKNGTKRTYKSNSIKFNETASQSYSISKDISFKYTKNNENNRYENNFIFINNRNNEINKYKDEDIIGDNIDEDIKINERNSPINSTKYFNTDGKKSKFNIYINYIDNQNIINSISQGNNLNRSEAFPLKYNYQKDKYISYFSNDNI